MPIDPRQSRQNIIAEIIRAYKEKGTIGNIRPRSMRHALRIAAAIASRVKREKRKKS